MKGDEIVRVTARKDQYGEVEEFICNECRFEKKDVKHWNIEGPRHISRHSVISLNHYQKPEEMVVKALENETAKEISKKDNLE
jgi:NADH-quinone oxidoreductase subunit G